MRKPERGRSLLRRINPNGWEDAGRTIPKVQNFVKKSSEEGLSVYQGVSPRTALQIMLDTHADYLRNAESMEARVRWEAWFQRNGTTVEELTARGWGVLELDASDVCDLGFTLDSPDEHGHVNVFGRDQEHFESEALNLRRLARCLDREQCLQGLPTQPKTE